MNRVKVEMQLFAVVCASFLVCITRARAGEATQELLLKDGGLVQVKQIEEQEKSYVIKVAGQELHIPKDKVIVKRRIEAVAKDWRYREIHGLKNRELTELTKDTEDAVVLVRRKMGGLGSGFLIHPDGYLITNDHVISGENNLIVTVFKRTDKGLIRKDYKKVKIVAASSSLDLALLKIEPEGSEPFPCVPLGDSRELSQGTDIFTFGAPMGLERSISRGIISLPGARATAGGLYLQTTAQISPGNSGGPMFNMKGEVVGVNNMKYVAQGAEGLGFAIPSVVVKLFLQHSESFVFDPSNPNVGFRYHAPPKSSDQ